MKKSAAKSSGKTARPLFLVADFGGTNARAALVGLGKQVVDIHRLESGKLKADQSPAEWLADYYKRAKKPEIAGCAACAAGPVHGQAMNAFVKFTNRDSEVRASQLAEACGLNAATLVNDFAAVAHAIPVLRSKDLKTIGSGKQIKAIIEAPQLAIGPGTGLGVALRVPAEGAQPVVVPAEGGHAALAPFDRETLGLWPILAELHDGQLSAEDVLCGPGLERLYAACAVMRGEKADRKLKAQDISKLGLSGKDDLCGRAVAVFTRWLGNYAGSLALVGGARGGVYLAGGILPSWGAKFDANAFRKAFDNQVAMRDYMRAIPVHLMQHAEPALAGLAALASQRVKQVSG